MSRPSRRPGPWYVDFLKRRRFERGVVERFPDFRGSVSRNVGRNGWAYRLVVPVEGYPSRSVQILFPPPSGRNTVVRSDGPTSPHRYRDGELCMWFPGDPAERRWVLDDGLLALIAQIQVHLFKEAWWRETAAAGDPEWLGDEAPHGEAPHQDKTTQGEAA